MESQQEGDVGLSKGFFVSVSLFLDEINFTCSYVSDNDPVKRENQVTQDYERGVPSYTCHWLSQRG